MTTRQLIRIIACAAFVAGCSPGTYDGDEVVAIEGGDSEPASFEFSLDKCRRQETNHFHLYDDAWRIPVDISGRVVNFGESDELDDDCRFFAELAYHSDVPGNPGSGRAISCFSGESDQEGTSVFRRIRVTVQSGPLEGYAYNGPYDGEALSHLCDNPGQVNSQAVE